MPTHLRTLPPPAHTGIRLARSLPAGTAGHSPPTPSLLSRPVVATERPTTQHGRHDPVHSSDRTSKVVVYLALVRRPSLPLPSPSSPPPPPPPACRLDTLSLLLLLDILIPSLQPVSLVAATSGRRGQSLRLYTVKPVTVSQHSLPRAFLSRARRRPYLRCFALSLLPSPLLCHRCPDDSPPPGCLRPPCCEPRAICALRVQTRVQRVQREPRQERSRL